MKIVSITVMTALMGTDEVFVHTDLPSPLPPSVCMDNMTMKFSVAAGDGVGYALRYFPEVPVTELNMKTSGRTQVRE